MRFLFSFLKTFCVAFLLVSIAPAPVLASKDRKAKEQRKLEKEAKKRDQRQRVEEQQDYFKKWLTEGCRLHHHG